MKRNSVSIRYGSARVAALASVLLLLGCGAETAGTAASVAGMQAEQAKQGKATLDSVSAKLDAAAQTSQDNLKKAEEAEQRP